MIEDFFMEQAFCDFVRDVHHFVRDAQQFDN